MTSSGRQLDTVGADVDTLDKNADPADALFE